MNVPLRELGLESKWKQLHKLQSDLAAFEARRRKADIEVTSLRAHLPQARAQDIEAAARAIRSGGKVPEPKHEPAVEADLERAERERDVSARLVQDLHEEIGRFMAQHQGAIFQDILEARGDVARELAQHARAALALFSRHEDLGAHVKRLRPAEPVVEGAPAARLTNSFAGIVGTQSIGPARGEVEGMLAYLVGLAPAQEADDAA